MRIAFAAAFVFVLQSLGAALAAASPPTQLDAFGNPLCVAGEAHSDGGRGDRAPHHLPACCVLGCAMASGHAATASAPGPIVLRRDVVRARLSEQYRYPPPVAPDHDPGSPRAPPLTA